MDYKENMMSSIVLVSALVFLVAISPIFVSGQSNQTTHFKGTNTIVLKILNPYDGGQWQAVENYAAQGFRVMSIIPSSQLETDVNNPSLILVVLQKFD